MVSPASPTRRRASPAPPTRRRASPALPSCPAPAPPSLLRGGPVGARRRRPRSSRRTAAAWPGASAGGAGDSGGGRARAKQPGGASVRAGSGAGEGRRRSRASSGGGGDSVQAGSGTGEAGSGDAGDGDARFRARGRSRGARGAESGGRGRAPHPCARACESCSPLAMAFPRGCVLFFLAAFLVFLWSVEAAIKELKVEYYAETCPEAEEIMRETIASAHAREARSIASVMRLQFHDCFVNGCDGSVLMDDTSTMLGEKVALSNINSLRSFEVIDEVKEALDEHCPGVVSCADIVVMVARNAVVHKLGRGSCDKVQTCCSS